MDCPEFIGTCRPEARPRRTEKYNGRDAVIQRDDLLTARDSCNGCCYR